VFNARDLPIRGFAQDVLLRGRFDVLLPEILDALQWILQASAPDAAAEEAFLNRLLDREEASLEELDALDPPADLLKDYLRNLEATDTAALGKIFAAQGLEPGLEASDELIGTAIDRVLRWGWMLTQYRTKITHKLLETYPTVQLATPATVDLDLWLEGGDADTKTSVRDQVRLYGLMSRFFQGRMHGIVAFDPYRQLTDRDGNGGTLGTVAHAIEKQAFVAVKLYPPMGFRAVGNTDLWPVGDPRRDVDVALGELYAYCIQESVPILAHCNSSNGSQPEFDEYASPVYWRNLLGQRPELRVCFGHFGGVDGLAADPEDSWAWTIAELMQSGADVFADCGYHKVALDASDAFKERYFTNLVRLVEAFPASADRIVYGSDWQMIMIERHHRRYSERYFSELARYFDEGFAQGVAASNGMRFLGLDGAESATRGRLERFYATHGIPLPQWWVA
jgi:predicted TIM-barrel fold metal-dependent hydrolase